MSTVRLDTIRDRVRNKTDTVSDGHITDEFLNDVINEGIRELQDRILATSSAKSLLGTSTTFTTTDDQDTYVIGSGEDIDISDFYVMLGLDVLVTSGSYREVRPYNWPDRNKLDYWKLDSAQDGRLYYDLIGSSIQLIPTPGGTMTLRLWYIPEPTELSADSDTYEGFNGWERYVEYYACVQVRMRQEKQIGEYERKLQQSLDNIVRMASKRDRLGVTTIADVWRRY